MGLMRLSASSRRQIAIDGRETAFDALPRDIIQPDVETGACADLRNTRAHLTGADDANFLDLHVAKLELTLQEAEILLRDKRLGKPVSQVQQR